MNETDKAVKPVNTYKTTKVAQAAKVSEVTPKARTVKVSKVTPAAQAAKVSKVVKVVQADKAVTSGKATKPANAAKTAKSAQSAQSAKSAKSAGTKESKQGCELCASGKHKDRGEAEYKDLMNRLKRIEGQVRGVEKMVENDAYCTDILTQVSAITSALNSFNKVLLGNHIKTCVADNIREGNEEVVDELVTVLQKLMK